MAFPHDGVSSGQRVLDAVTSTYDRLTEPNSLPSGYLFEAYGMSSVSTASPHTYTAAESSARADRQTERATYRHRAGARKHTSQRSQPHRARRPVFSRGSASAEECELLARSRTATNQLRGLHGYRLWLRVFKTAKKIWARGYNVCGRGRRPRA